MSLMSANSKTNSHIGSLSRLSNATFWAYGLSPSNLFDSNIDIDYLDAESDLPLTE